MMNTLMDYDWPGNVRELENVVERALIVSTGNVLEALEPLGHTQPPARDAAGSLRRGLRETERKQILGALQTSRWKIKGEGNAASRLGLKPSSLRSRMRSLGIERPD
jgi:chemotaxis protein methyltransferase CheR